MKEMFPDCNVVWYNKEIKQEPEGDDPEFWATWKGVIRWAMTQRAPETGPFFNKNWNYPDVVFASEEYGHKLAATVNARFVPVDISRTARDISATRIRANPFENWEYIPHVVRPYFVKRITLFGPESSGKSTLACALAKHYHTINVPEYGRMYTEAFGAEVNERDLKRITEGHLASVAAGKRQANRILIEDTDPVMTGVWSNILTGSRDKWFDDYCDYPALYILTDVDIPWEDDGTRYFRDETKRRSFYEMCEAELVSRGVRYVKVSGTVEERMATATVAIDKIILDS
jgi:HTH-type transcriptional repressor of NAD biosynthesis genes